jgi:glycosyltransferase involved in cell wall biosynthesis
LNAPLRIAVVAACPFPLPRGTPVRILRMAEALAGRGHEIHVVTYHLGTGEVGSGVRVHRIRKLRFYNKLDPGPSYRKLALVDPLLALRLRRLLREMPFDVIHAHHYEGAMVAAAARVGRRVPMVYDAHTLLMTELPFYSLGLPDRVKRSAGAWMDGWIPKLADHTVCVTETIRDKLVGAIGLDAGRVSVLPNGVEFDRLDPAPYPANDGTGSPLLMFTGNLAEYQGIDLMLKAFKLVLERIPGARLLIASDTPFEPYESMSKDLGIRGQIDVVRSPPFSGLPALLARADVALNPRVDCDGVPVKLLNYMAAGRAVVSFSTSAPGVVHGQTGWLATSGDVASFADGIVTLLQNRELGRHLGQAARRFVGDNYRWPIVAERCESLYRSLIAAAGK